MKIGDILQILLTTEDEIIFGNVNNRFSGLFFKRRFNLCSDKPDTIFMYKTEEGLISGICYEKYTSIGSFIDCVNNYLNVEDDWKMYEIEVKEVKTLKEIK